MLEISRIVSPAPDDQINQLRNIYFDIERKARLSGDANILMLLDRVPRIFLGAENNIKAGAEDEALADAFASLELVLAELQSSRAK